MLAVLAAYVVGILTAFLFQLPFWLLIGFGLSVLILGLYTQYFSWKKGGPYFLLAIMAFGAVMYQWQEDRNKGSIASLAGKAAVVSGTIAEEPDVRVNAVNYVIKVVDKNCSGNVLVTVKNPQEIYSYGDMVEVRGVPEEPREPGNPGEFNYKRYLETRGIQLIIKSWQGAGIRKTGTGHINPVTDVSLAVKHKLISVLFATLSEKHAGLAQAIIFGSTGRLDPQARDDFALTGVVHILSVSGYHVGVLTAICLMLGSLLGMSRAAGSAFTVIMTAFYAVMTGASPPVIRATVMAWVLLLARAVRRDYDWPRAMAMAAMVILLFQPNALFKAGFQLSFLATWGILDLAPVLSHVSAAFIAFTSGAGRAAIITLAAQIAVLPVSAYYFNYVSLISLPANLIIVPLVSLAMLLGGSAALIGSIWLPCGQLLNISTGVVLDLVLKIANLLAQVPFGVITVGQPAVMEVVGFYLIILFALQVKRKPHIGLRLRRFWMLQRKLLIPSFLLFAGLFIWAGILFPAPGDLEITFVDIGQGDAAYIETPKEYRILIDTGGTAAGGTGYNPGESVLVPFLRRRGIDHLDMVLLTHAHADHIQGSEALLDGVSVRVLVVNRQFCENPEGAKAVREFAAKGTEIREISGGDKVVCAENIILEALYPDNPDFRADNENNNSLITRLRYGEFQVLLTGDAEEEALRELAGDAAGTAGLEADVVKVPHHGSKTGWVEEFYRLVNPKTAVISVGPNYFGHPSEEVVRGLAGLGINTFRTDRDGAVIISSDGHNYSIKTGRGRIKAAGENL